MKLKVYIDENLVVRYHENWPVWHNSFKSNDSYANFLNALSKAKSESVPFEDQNEALSSLSSPIHTNSFSEIEIDGRVEIQNGKAVITKFVTGDTVIFNDYESEDDIMFSYAVGVRNIVLSGYSHFHAVAELSKKFKITRR